MKLTPCEQHLSHLRVECLVKRTIPLPGNGGGVAWVLKAALLPAGDERCGVLTDEFQYGGSVPEGWAEQLTLVLPDAYIQTTDFDVETNTFVEVYASSEARADELQRLVEQAAAR